MEDKIINARLEIYKNGYQDKCKTEKEAQETLDGLALLDGFICGKIFPSEWTVQVVFEE